MSRILFWIFLCNAVILINHEVDSAYWKEWELFNMKGGVTGFLLIHFPLFFILLWGLVEMDRGSLSGLVVSAVLAATGIFAAVVHSMFLMKGDEKFRLPVSIGILAMTGILSVVQLGMSIYLILT